MSQEQIANAESTAEYAPVVKLDAVEVDNGEKDEKEIYKQSSGACALYRFDSDTKEWKQRGRGDVRLMQHNTSKQVRVILREAKTLKLRMNHFINPTIELTANPGSDRTWTWACTDYSEETPETVTFALKFRNSEVAEEFKVKYDECRKLNEGLVGDDKKKDDRSKVLLMGLLNDSDMEPFPEDDLKKLWDVYDKDGNNSIDNKELTSLLTDLIGALVQHYKIDDAMHKEVALKVPSFVETTLKALDVNKDGRLSWDEFRDINTVDLVV